MDLILFVAAGHRNLLLLRKKQLHVEIRSYVASTSGFLRLLAFVRAASTSDIFFKVYFNSWPIAKIHFNFHFEI